MDELHHWLSVTIIVLLVAWAAIADLRRREIPDAIPVLLVLGWLLVLLFGAADLVWWWHPLTATVVLALLFFPFCRGWIGGGDVKLLCALTLWAGPAHTPMLLSVTAMAGGLLAIAYLVTQRIGAAGGARPVVDARLPYAVAIAVGGIWLAIGS